MSWLTTTRSVPLMMKVPFSRHQGKFAEEDFGDGDLVARFAIDEGDLAIERRGVGHVTIDAFVLVVLRWVEAELEAKFARFLAAIREVDEQVLVVGFDGADFAEERF